ncbi:phosphoribosyltransferase-like protein [Aspergillus egyptiacus]|nr:phosphoribosyltransferase-like protein [Aspergillus egyptiacus]
MCWRTPARPALTRFFQDQVRHRPRLPGEHFLNVVYAAGDTDVLLVTGMRDEAPVAVLSHLVPHIRLLEVRVRASGETRRIRLGYDSRDCDSGNEDKDYSANLIFDNNLAGDDEPKRFAKQYLLPFLHKDLERLASMVRPVPDFPEPGIEFRHVLDISQQPGGLPLCVSLLQSHFIGDWGKVDAIACSEAGGYIFASALSSQVNVRLALIREARKLPPPTASVCKPTSHISSFASNDSKQKRIEMCRDSIPRGATVVVVDDVLATGNTLCAVLELLDKVSNGAIEVSVMVVAEFPVHRGRELLRQRGFGRVKIQSLSVFGGARERRERVWNLDL